MKRRTSVPMLKISFLRKSLLPTPCVSFQHDSILQRIELNFPAQKVRWKRNFFIRETWKNTELILSSEFLPSEKYESQVSPKPPYDSKLHPTGNHLSSALYAPGCFSSTNHPPVESKWWGVFIARQALTFITLGYDLASDSPCNLQTQPQGNFSLLVITELP